MKDLSETACGISIGLVIGFMIGWFAGLWIASVNQASIYEKAIKAGVAEYTVNPQTGETTFTYKAIK